MKTNCISVYGVEHELELLESDAKGFYKYKMHPMELGYEPKIIYIAPNREDYWMYGKPMEGGKQIHRSKVRHFFIIN